MENSKNNSYRYAMDFDNDYELVTEITSYDGEHKEINIYLRSKKDRLIVQDIALVRKSETSNDEIECLVWADELNEDFTHKFPIKVFKDEQ